MQIIVNGTPRDIPEQDSLLALLKELKLDPDTTLAELNRVVLGKNSYGEVTFHQGDRLELVRFVGGG